VPAHDLRCVPECVFLVPRIDPLGRVRQQEIFPGEESRRLEEGANELIRGSGIRRGLQDHESSWFQTARHVLARPLNEGKIRRPIPDGSRDADQNDVATRKRAEVAREDDPTARDSGPEERLVNPGDREDAPPKVFESGSINVETDRSITGVGGRADERYTHVSLADNADHRRPSQDAIFESLHGGVDVAAPISAWWGDFA
jgi:hypothetical protein